jgi:hypothetical protein
VIDDFEQKPRVVLSLVGDRVSSFRAEARHFSEPAELAATRGASGKKGRL